MSKDEIFAKVVEVTANHFGEDKSEIKAGTAFADDLSADSLDIIEIVMALEKEFGVGIPDEDVEKIKTIQDSVYYIEKILEKEGTC